MKSTGANAKKKAAIKSAGEQEPLTEPEVQMRSAMAVILAELSAKKHVNVATSLDDVKAMKAVFNVVEELHEAMTSHKMWKPMLKVFSTEVENKDVAYHTSFVPQAALALTLQKKLTTKVLFSKMRTTAVLSKHLFTLMGYEARDHHHTCLPLLHCMSECRIVVNGVEVIIGLKLTTSKSLGDQIRTFESLDGAALTARIQDDDCFAMILRGWNMAVLPSGFVYRIYRPVRTFGIRWSFFPDWDGEKQRAHRAVSESLELFPTLKTTKYNDLQSELEKLQ